MPTDGRTRDTEQYILNDVKDSVYNALDVLPVNALVPEAFDYIALTYVAAGDGIGEIETVTYKSGGSGGTTVATLTLAYNGDDKLATITRS